MPDLFDITIIIAVITIIYTMCKIASSSERRRFNNGICKECGNKLYHFDTDSQGGRGYVCKNCDFTIWVTYPSVDKRFLINEGSM